MEYYSKKQPDHLQLIRGIFYMIAGATLIGLVLLFTLNINRKATVPDGEIISQNAPIQFIAPMEAVMGQINIKEGDKVMAGDKLIVLKNPKLEDDLEVAKRKLDAIHKSIEIDQAQLQNLTAKMNRHGKQLSILSNKYENKKDGSSLEISGLDEQLENLEEKINISKNRINTLKKLFDEGGISGQEYDKLYNAYLDEQNKLISTRNQSALKNSTSDRIDIEMAEDENELSLVLLKTKTEYLDKEKELESSKRKIKEIESEIEIIKLGLESLVLKATVDGYVSDLFTTKLKSSIISEKQLLFVLNPQVEEEFFAKVQLKEEEIKDILPGQEVRLKLSAFNHYQYGVMKGKVMRVNKEVMEGDAEISGSKIPGNSFYALVGIPESEAQKFQVKSGFRVKGDIILNRVKLYRFIIESMFKK